MDEGEVGRRTVRVSASIGLAMAAPGTTLDETLSLTARAMYGSKKPGRGVLHMMEWGTKRHRAEAATVIRAGPHVAADPELSG